MKFKIYNCDTIKKYTETTSHIVIQVASPSTKRHIKLPENKNRLAKLALKFHALDERSMSEEDLAGFGNTFDKAHAADIISFVRVFSHKIETIIVHCEAGISRSPAIAAALDSWLNGSETVDWFRRYLPNRLVYKVLRNEIAHLH